MCPYYMCNILYFRDAASIDWNSGFHFWLPIEVLPTTYHCENIPTGECWKPMENSNITFHFTTCFKDKDHYHYIPLLLYSHYIILWPLICWCSTHCFLYHPSFNSAPTFGVQPLRHRTPSSSGPHSKETHDTVVAQEKTSIPPKTNMTGWKIPPRSKGNTSTHENGGEIPAIVRTSGPLEVQIFPDLIQFIKRNHLWIA